MTPRKDLRWRLTQRSRESEAKEYDDDDQIDTEDGEQRDEHPSTSAGVGAFVVSPQPA
jgi:hypothetical protein